MERIGNEEVSEGQMLNAEEDVKHEVKEVVPELSFYHFAEEDEGPVDGKYVIVRTATGEELFATLPRRRAELHSDIVNILGGELGEKVTCIGGGYFEKIDPYVDKDMQWAVQGKSSEFGAEENRKRTAALVQAQFPELIIRS
ncbi:MAG TPA: hypothetical protein VJ579_04830 [Candidatus Paceibacterota bacterium]|nr:hypothetical protein [Candidatus Paceibacterota bacterium]